jgi:hypothetical protein
MDLPTVSIVDEFLFDISNECLIKDAVRYDVKKQITPSFYAMFSHEKNSENLINYAKKYIIIEDNSSLLHALFVSENIEESYYFLYLFFSAQTCVKADKEGYERLLLAACLPQYELIINYPKQLQSNLRSAVNSGGDVWPIIHEIAEHILLILRQNLARHYEKIAQEYADLYAADTAARRRKMRTPHLPRSKSLINFESSSVSTTRKNKEEKCVVS